MRSAVLAIIFTTLSSSAAADSTSCASGEAWDTGMAMCMPVPKSGATASTNARAWDEMTSPEGCGSASWYSFGMSMCVPRPAALGRFSGMVMGNVFGAGVFEEGPRGRQAFSAPNWVMADIGVDLAPWNRLSLDAMVTAELWTTPAAGYPELLQIGENQADGKPFLDAQHPHSSPIMGLTLSDTFALGGDRLLTLSFAPRGESTDGPIAFMHRATGTMNPDAPLGHHVGQDAGHVTSTVIAASALFGTTEIEASTFYGLEPDPTRVDLPLGRPDSAALRVSERFGSFLTGAASAAYVNNPEGAADIPHVVRISASTYTQSDVLGHWRLKTSEVFGGVFGFDQANFLPSLLGEALLSDDDANEFWGRLEVLQRTPGELEIQSSSPNLGQWAGALTLGATRKIVSVWGLDIGAGGSATASFLPDDYAASYGGAVVFSGKVFLEVRYMQMFSTGPAAR